MAYLVIDSASQAPQPYSPLPPQPGSGLLLPLYAVGPGVALSKDSSPDSFSQSTSGIASRGIVDSESPGPQPYNPLPPQPGAGVLLPLYAVGPGVALSKDSPPNANFAQTSTSGTAYEGNVDSPYALSFSYGNEVSNVHTMGGTLGVEVAPGTPTDAFATDEPYGQGFGAVQPTVQPWPIASAG